MANHLTLRLSAVLTSMIFCISFFSKAQVSYRYLASFGTALVDINDSGHAVLGGATFDYASSVITPKDTDVAQLNGINNNGDLIGLMPIIISGQMLYQPAYKKNGTWFPIGLFPNAGTDAAASVYQISENGNYVAGQMSPDCCDYQAFLYDAVADTLERIANPANEYSAGYCVNDSGIIGGWYDPQPSGTLRVPAIMRTGSIVSAVPPALSTSTGGQVSAINNSNVMVGDFDNQPFIYDLNNNTSTLFNVPANYQTATFTSISENGVAVGYCQIFDFGTITRDAIIYHPQLGPQPLLLKDVLASHNVYVPTPDSLLGTAIAISPDGNYICGWENGQFFFASGWAVNFDDSLLSSAVSELNEAGFRVFPNPTTDRTSIRSKENIQTIRVFDSLSKIQLSIAVNSKSADIDLSKLSTGIYFVEATSAHGSSVIKLVRQ